MNFKKRSPEEIKFRVRQEAANLQGYLRPPKGLSVPMKPVLPPVIKVVEALRGSSFEDQVIIIADEILAHRFPLLGGTLETGTDIHWRKDYSCGIETRLSYFRWIPYLDASRAGDHKNIWELNRHQHLVILAQAGLFSGKEKYWKELLAQLDSWFTQNPYGCGINWTSALEVAFRSLSWIWLLHLGQDRFDEVTKEKLTHGLFQHAVYLENNLSVYFAPNTHLLGEALALHAVGTLFPGWAESKRWVDIGGRIVLEEMDKQVRPDGAHFEQSTYYHVYALDMFLFHVVMSRSNPYEEKLAKMSQYLESILGPGRRLAFFGDDDGGRFFHPYGRHDQYGRATLATCAHLLKMTFVHDYDDLMEHAVWWLGPEAFIKPRTFRARESRLFPEVGMASLVSGETHILMDVGPFGPWTGGHSHADTLSITLRHGTEDILVDSGTFTYVGDAAERNYFRGTGAHNTIRIDHNNQATPNGSFSWVDRPEVKIIGFESTGAQDMVKAECHYLGFRHRRYLLFRKSEELILVGDFVDGPPGTEHEVEQIWRFGEATRLLEPGVFQIGNTARLLLPGNTNFSMDGWRSRAFATKEQIPVARQVRRGAFPGILPAAISLNGKKNVSFNIIDKAVEFTVDGAAFRLGD